MNKLLIIPFLFVTVQDTTRVDTTMKPMVSIFEQNTTDKMKRQFEMNNAKIDTIGTKLDSIIKILEKRKK